MKSVQVTLMMHPPCREDHEHERCEGALEVRKIDTGEEVHPTIAVCTCACHWRDFDAALAVREARRQWSDSEN